MDIAMIKELAQKYSAQELEEFAMQLEDSGTCALLEQEKYRKEDLGEVMSDLLQAKEIRMLLDEGKTLQEAMRAFSQRVRTVLK